MNAHLARRVREAIVGAGLSQAAAAKRCGVTPQAIGKWVTTGELSVANLMRLADATGQAIGFFFPQSSECRALSGHAMELAHAFDRVKPSQRVAVHGCITTLLNAMRAEGASDD
jgi:transcriptional regulator with XRE-family HTH domain